jgi:hypothetical protein
MRRFGLHAALSLCFVGLPATAAERYGEWLLDQPSGSILALSFQRSITFNNKAATSELAFVCNPENKYVGVILIPFEGTFKNQQVVIRVVIRKSEDQYDHSDLLQHWKNGLDYIFSESPDEAEELASYLIDRESEGVKSVHFYFPNDLSAGQQISLHTVIDISGVSNGLGAFKKECERTQ